VQVHVLSRSGIHIAGVDVMHLNKECHFPDLSNLFERTDVTAAVQPLLGKVGWEIDRTSCYGAMTFWTLAGLFCALVTGKRASSESAPRLSLDMPRVAALSVKRCKSIEPDWPDND